MKPTYLSIDLDYWNLDRTSQHGLDLFRKLFKLRVPFAIVDDHDGLIEFADKSKATKLINIDYHSDYANFTEEEFEDDVPNCGTWIDHVKRLEEFEWRYPSHHSCFRLREGRCESWGQRSNTLFWGKGVSRRGHIVKHLQGTKFLPFSSIVAVGVAVSEMYWNNEDVIQDIMNFLSINRRRFKYIEPSVDWMWRRDVAA